MGRCGTVPKPTGAGSWTTGARRTSSRWPAARRRKGMTTGPCACWLAKWWSWGWRPPCTVPFLPQAAAPRRGGPPKGVQALVTERNAAQATINWRFNTQDA